MGLDLYYTDLSPDNQSVLMAIQFMGLDVNKKLINVRMGEQKTPEFLKINPQHSLPTIVDDGFPLWESRAILIYLAVKFDNSEKLYPKDNQKRAKVDRSLFFNVGTLQARFQSHYMITVRNGLPIEPEKFKLVEEAVSFLDKDLEKSEFVAGDDLTIADFCNVATMHNYEAAGFPIGNYPNVKRWMTKCESLGLKTPEQIMTLLKGFFAPKK